MEAYLLNQLMGLQTLLTTLENMAERLDNEFTLSEKRMIDDWRTQYTAARGETLQQLGMSVVPGYDEAEPPLTEHPEMNPPVTTDKKPPTPKQQKSTQKQTSQQQKKQQEDYPE